MRTSIKMQGSCNCKKVQFKINTKVTGLYQCHCKLCQKQSGSTSNTAVIVPAEHFIWLSGKQAITKWKKESGFTCHFCSTCGSPVPNILRGLAFYWIPMGLVDKCDVEISTHICTNDKASWDIADLHGTVYKNMPDDLTSFISSFCPVE